MSIQRRLLLGHQIALPYVGQIVGNFSDDRAGKWTSTLRR